MIVETVDRMTSENNGAGNRLLQADAVSFQAGERHLLQDVSLSLFGGEVVGLIGPNGAGKSTLLKLLSGIWKLSAGQIVLCGKPLAAYRPKEIARVIGQVPQSPVLDVPFTVRDIVLMGRNPHLGRFEIERPYDRQVADDAMQATQTLELADRPITTLSGGERQRIVIARALATNPRLIVADEAISALDVSIRAQILNLLQDLQHEFGLTYLFIAHDLSVVRHICDRVNVMYVGKLVESAEATALYTYPKHPYTEALMSAVPIHNPRLRDKGRRIRLQGDVADPANPPDGCYFHPRCRYVQKQCSLVEPPLRPIEGQDEKHAVACHFADELTLRGVIASDSVE